MDVGTLNSWDIENVVNSEYILKIISNNYKLSKLKKIIHLKPLTDLALMMEKVKLVYFFDI